MALKEKETKKGKSEATAHASVQRRARDKFRKGSGNTLLVQGQFGELLLFPNCNNKLNIES